MHSRWLLLPAASLSLFFVSCANKGPGGSIAGGNPQGLGPFDSRGNYVESWADNPSQWKKGSSSQVADATPDRAASTTIPVSPEFVKVEEVPANSVPYQQGPTTVTYKKTTPTPTRRHVEEEDAPKSKSTTKSTAVAKNTSKSSPSSSSKTTTKSKSSSTVAKSTPKKATVKKELVKSKPKSTSHTVKSGDNLYNIAKRYGTSVAAIQKANGTKGAMIKPGQSLVIPR